MPRARDRDRRGRRARRPRVAARPLGGRDRRDRAATSHSEEHVRAAKADGADAIHPGYGFLAENADFAEAVGAAGLVWVGPPPEALRARRRQARGEADRARGRRAGRPDRRAGGARLSAALKAAAGGGGRGMRVVRARDELDEALEAARREAKAAFGDDRVFFERYVERPRHVEIQLLADAHGNGRRARRARVLDPAAAPEGARGDRRRPRSTPRCARR